MFRSLARLARGKTSVTVPIGHVQKLGEGSEFKIGQHFIHSNLNYRGVVLFPVKEDIYIYNEKTRDYFPKKALDCYHVLVDKRDLNETPNAIYKELIFTDRKQLYLVDGFDRIAPTEMLPYKPIAPTSAGEAAYGIGATLHDAITANINAGFVDFSNPWYQRFIYQFDGEPKATGHAMKWQHDHKSQVTTYVRDSWPEGIRVSISTQYLAFNDKTLIDPQTLMKTKKGTLGLMNAFNQMMHPEPPHIWKYNVHVQLLDEKQEYTMVEQSLKWELESDVKKLKTPGIPIVTDTGAERLFQFTISKNRPDFKCTSHVMLDHGAASFKGHFLFRNRNGREVIIQLPPYLLYSPNVKASSTPENTET